MVMKNPFRTFYFIISLFHSICDEFRAFTESNAADMRKFKNLEINFQPLRSLLMGFIRKRDHIFGCPTIVTFPILYSDISSGFIKEYHKTQC